MQKTATWSSCSLQRQVEWWCNHHVCYLLIILNRIEVHPNQRLTSVAHFMVAKGDSRKISSTTWFFPTCSGSRVPSNWFMRKENLKLSLFPFIERTVLEAINMTQLFSCKPSYLSLSVEILPLVLQSSLCTKGYSRSLCCSCHCYWSSKVSILVI